MTFPLAVIKPHHFIFVTPELFTNNITRNDVPFVYDMRFFFSLFHSFHKMMMLPLA